MYRIIGPRAARAKGPRDAPKQSLHPYFALWHQWGDAAAAFTLLLGVLRLAGWLALRYRRAQKAPQAAVAAEGGKKDGPPAAAGEPKEAQTSGKAETPLQRAGRLARNAVWAAFPLTIIGTLVL